MQNNSENQEIDLSQIGKSINNFFQNIITNIFKLIFFLIEKKWILGAIFILGAALGFYIDRGKEYQNEITLIPNFGSNQYLYDQIAVLENKIKVKDVDFLNKIGIKNANKIKKIEIEPVHGLYSFISDRERGGQNFEMIKLMAEDGDLTKIIEDELTSKNYYLHKISIESGEFHSEKELFEPLMSFLENNKYFKEQQKIYIENNNQKIKLNDSLIKQIDVLLGSVSKSQSSGTISFTEKSSISTLIDKKDNLIKENQYLKIDKILYDKILKVERNTLNMEQKYPLYLRMKFILPFVFIALYLIGYQVFRTYKKQLETVKNK
jgi:hypothetical protein